MDVSVIATQWCGYKKGIFDFFVCHSIYEKTSITRLIPSTVKHTGIG